MFIVRPMQEGDLQQVSQLNRECFPEDTSSLEGARDWVEATWRATPRTTYFVLMNAGGQIGGYILWMEKGGFRKSAVLELEQIGVTSTWRGKGCAKSLIQESIRAMKARLEVQGRILKLVEVTTSTDNKAQRLYANTLGALAVATIRDLFDDDEIIMVARNP
jgi:ribosomal protein S18 acetylase RimI-like enzyme